jgi:hypothetical protein
MADRDNPDDERRLDMLLVDMVDALVTGWRRKWN